MKNLNFLIKPASSLCNMRCRYCFYADEAASRSMASAGVMQQETSDLLIQEAFSSVDERGLITFAFQGGEPTLAGLDYFRHFVETVKKYNTKRAAVQYAIQTNGLLLDEVWAEFFAENEFLVGLSMDGEKAIHDAFRVDIAGKGTWNRIAKNLALLQRKKVLTNILCVVSKPCAKSPEKVYRNLKKMGATHLQFIPCLDPIEVERGILPHSLTPAQYGEFLCILFDEWYRDWKSGQYTSIRFFDDFVHLAMGLPAGTCSTGGSCGAYFVVEGDGTLYPCDFYCLDQWMLGKIGDVKLENMACHPLMTEFLQESLNRPVECGVCRWKRLCNGGCKRDWYKDETGNHNYLCPAFKKFFVHTEQRLWEIARLELLVQNAHKR